MKPVKMHEAKTNFSKLISLVEGGQEIVVQRGDVPVAKIVPYAVPLPRRAGGLRGKLTIKPGFDELPEGFGEYTT